MATVIIWLGHQKVQQCHCSGLPPTVSFTLKPQFVVCFQKPKHSLLVNVITADIWVTSSEDDWMGIQGSMVEGGMERGQFMVLVSVVSPKHGLLQFSGSQCAWSAQNVAGKRCAYLSIIVQQDATIYSLLYFCKLLYMFWVVTPPIIRSTYNCNCSIWQWSDRLCYLPLWWRNWNWVPTSPP